MPAEAKIQAVETDPTAPTMSAFPTLNGIDETSTTVILHQLAERVTAIGNYVAAACRLHEIEAAEAFASHAGEILHEALAQVRAAGRAFHELHAVLGARDADPRPDARSAYQTPSRPYRVHFLNAFARGSDVVHACQRTLTIRSARSPERAIEAAKKRFARIEGIPDWRVHAQIIALEVVGAEAPLFDAAGDRRWRPMRPPTLHSRRQ
jgi:hypothetical protein